jgi:uncharacterized membrane protein
MFGVAMTLLSTTLIPRVALSGSAFTILRDISGALFVVGLSFTISGSYWIMQQRQLEMSPSLTPRQTLLHFVFLFLIVLLPISTAVLGRRGATQPVTLRYGAHLALISLLSLLLWLLVARPASSRSGSPDRL